jgi:hypothetical protein
VARGAQAGPLDRVSAAVAKVPRLVRVRVENWSCRRMSFSLLLLLALLVRRP